MNYTAHTQRMNVITRHNSIVMQDLLIPRVTVGTKLYYEVPAHTWTAYEGPSIYDFGGTLSLLCFAFLGGSCTTTVTEPCDFSVRRCGRQATKDEDRAV